MSPDAYHLIARLYDPLFEHFDTGLRAIGLKLYPPRAGMAVLDVGCGTGSTLALYAGAGCAVFGIDRSPAMLDVAQRKLGAEAGLLLGDATRMPYPDGRFDLITSMLALHEMRAAVRAGVIEEMKRALKPEGRILLIDFHPGPYRFPGGWVNKALNTVVEFAAGWEHFRNHLVFLRAGGLPALAAGHGLVVDQQKIVSGGTMALFLLRRA